MKKLTNKDNQHEFIAFKITKVICLALVFSKLKISVIFSRITSTKFM